MKYIKDTSIIFLVVFFFASTLFGIHMFGKDFNILIAIILYGGLYLVLAYRNAKKLERQIKNKDLPKELKDLDEE